MDLFEAIKTRRSIRRFTTDPVDDKQIEAILEAGRWAPSWKNSQCWRFIIVRDTGLKDKLADCLIGPIRDNVRGKNPATEAVRQAPVVIVACAELGRSGRDAGAFVTDKGDWYMFDCALAMENIALAAHGLGLGTVNIGAFDAKIAAVILKVPAGFCVVEMMPLGVPLPGQEVKTPPRKEMAEIAFRDSWGNSY